MPPKSKSKERVKKLVSVLATSTPVTGTKEEAVETAESVETAKLVDTAEVGKNGKESKGEYPNLARVPWIRSPITLGKKSVLALFDLGSEVNAIHLTLAQKLRLPIRQTDVGV